MNIRLDIEYDGSLYHGWQIQKDADTVQESIEKALEIILRERVTIIGAGRTDTGVHAIGQVANFKVNKLLMTMHQLMQSLNGILREGIAIKSVAEVDESFHARYSALARSYTYTVSRRKVAIDRRKCYTVMCGIDIELMRNAAQSILGTHDFKQLSVDPGKKSTLCTVYELSIITDGDRLFFNITANRFLHKMVRIIVGTLLAIGKGRADPMILERLLNGDEGKKTFCAPAHGLTLVRVDYP